MVKSFNPIHSMVLFACAAMVVACDPVRNGDSSEPEQEDDASNSEAINGDRADLAGLPAFCSEIPRPGWAAFEKHTASNDWFEVYRLSEDLFAIAEPYQWQEVISYLIVGNDSALLFDSGNGMGDIRAIVDQLTDHPVSVLASHSHIDHVGGHWQFETVLATENDFTARRAAGASNEFVREEASPPALCKSLPNGVSVDNHHTKPFTPSEFVSDGSLIDLGGTVLEVLLIPGHTPDSLALLDREQGRLFTGDSFYDGPIWLYAPETDLAAYGRSLDRFTELVPDLTAVYGAHNEPFSAPDVLIDLHDAFADVMAGRIVPSEETESQVLYSFDRFEILMQAGHEKFE